MRILNLYAGIGGNRKLWGNEHEITAVEIDENIAKIYQDFFPKDKVIVTDAHQFLLEHYQEFDFIWSSPPCQSHSRINTLLINGRGLTPKFPDMKLYQEILLLKHYFKGKWVVENVISFYEPLIKPQKIGRHFYWSNFNINIKEKQTQIVENRKGKASLNIKMKRIGIKVNDFHKYSGDKRTLINNCVEPQTGLDILNLISCKNCNVLLEEYKDDSNNKWIGCPRCDENDILLEELKEKQNETI